jgi:hypothetical protein
MRHWGFPAANGVLLAVALGGCAKCSEPAPDPAPPVDSAPRRPRVNMADQARLQRDGGFKPRPPSPDAVAVGRSLRKSVAGQCADRQCFYARCAPLCAQWLRERDARAGAQDLYIECVGHCAFVADGGA